MPHSHKEVVSRVVAHVETRLGNCVLKNKRGSDLVKGCKKDQQCYIDCDAGGLLSGAANSTGKFRHEILHSWTLPKVAFTVPCGESAMYKP